MTTPKVLFITAEASPWAKTGGLADVSAALGRALAGQGARVRLVMPYYRAARQAAGEAAPVFSGLKPPGEPAGLVADILGLSPAPGLEVHFVAREDMFDRPGLYNGPQGDYYDNLERFAFFCRAALASAQATGFRPDIVHAHDWQAGLAPALLAGPLAPDPFWAQTSTVFTIHNLGYQGLFGPERLAAAGLSQAEFFSPQGLEFYGDISLLKAGLVYAQALTTVSPTYARQVRTPEYGQRLEGLLEHRRADLHGILNGVDYQAWNPATDEHLPANYTAGDLAGKAACKAALARELGLGAVEGRAPLVGMVTRLDRQKGIELVLEAAPEILGRGAGLAILGAGEPGLESRIKRLAAENPGRAAARIGFDEPLAHRLIAGADILLMPSLYEPCGLTQLYALRYGAVPVVRATGGLADTVVNYEPRGRGATGFTFQDFSAAAMMQALGAALRAFGRPRTWARLQANGMARDFSWSASADRYLELYQQLMKKKGG